MENHNDVDPGDKVESWSDLAEQSAAIDTELSQKAVVVRDGARGWRLGACFVDDALDLLEADDALRAEFEVPAEDSEEYEFVNDMANELEGKLGDKGFTTIWNDGYVIYKDLSEAALEALQDY